MDELLFLLYTYPIGIVFAGILKPSTGDIIYIGGFLVLLSYLRVKRIKL